MTGLLPRKQVGGGGVFIYLGTGLISHGSPAEI